MFPIPRGVPDSYPFTTGTFGQAQSGTRSVDPASVGYMGFGFSAPSRAKLSTVKVTVTLNDVAGNWNARLYSDNAGSPGTLISTSPDLNITSAADWTFTWNEKPTLQASTRYWIVLVPHSGVLATFSVCANQAGYYTDRDTTITSMTDDNFGGTQDWRMEIVGV